MKRFLAILCCLTMLCASSMAEVDFDVDDYSQSELAEIYSLVSEKLNDCVIVPQGFYIVGTDLPAGRYVVMRNSDLPGDDPEFSWVAIFNNVDDYKKETSHWSWDSEDSQCVDMCNTLWGGMTCELTDGMVLAVGFGTAGIRKVESGIFSAFWN